MLAGETKKRDWRWQGEPEKSWEKVAWERTKEQAEMWQTPSVTLLHHSQQGLSSLVSLELTKWGQVWFRSKGKFSFWSKMERCEFCFRVHMLPLQAGGWSCFIWVSSVGKGREGSGQSSPRSSVVVLLRAPDVSALSSLSVHGPQLPSWIAVPWADSVHGPQPPPWIAGPWANSVHAPQPPSWIAGPWANSVHGPQPPSWIEVLWIASLYTAPSLHLGLQCCEQTVHGPQLPSWTLKPPSWGVGIAILQEELWSEGLCTWTSVSTWNQTKHKGGKKVRFYLITQSLFISPGNC